MKVNYFWKKDFPNDLIEITTNLANKHIVDKIDVAVKEWPELVGINQRNNRKEKVRLVDVEAIESYAHLSKIYTANMKGEFLLQKRIKELLYLEKYNFYRINNSTILNLDQISFFEVGEYARLEVVTASKKQYTVSRHYAKRIKEELVCSKT